jgi:hypothetical protein
MSSMSSFRFKSKRRHVKNFCNVFIVQDNVYKSCFLFRLNVVFSIRIENTTFPDGVTSRRNGSSATIVEKLLFLFVMLCSPDYERV